MVRYCAVNLCLSSTNQEGRKFYKFPKNEYRCQQWIRAAGRDDLQSKNIETISKHYFVCDLHFKESDRFKKRLKCNAVPSLNLNSPLNLTTVNKCTQTDTITNLTKDFSCQVNLCQVNLDISTTQLSQSTQSGSMLSSNSPRKRKLKQELQVEYTKRK